MMTDLLLAIMHHIAIFALFATLVAEIALVKVGIDFETARRVQKIDRLYGLLAACILIVGIARVTFAAKGWYYYEHNAFFWCKMTTFLAIGLLSVPPTIRYLGWSRSGDQISNGEVHAVRNYLWLQLGLFVPLLGFAAAMARGYGSY